MARLLVVAISFYQRYLSPYKGFRCAHAVCHSGESCSAAVKNIIQRKGILRGWSDIKRRFSDCKAAGNELNKKKDKRKKDEPVPWWTDCAGCIPCSPCDKAPKNCDLPCDCSLF